MRYERFDRLASGGKAEVFFCRDIVLGRPNALKLLHPQFRKTPLEERLLVREVRAMAALAHPANPEVPDLAIRRDGLILLCR